MFANELEKKGLAAEGCQEWQCFVCTILKCRCRNWLGEEVVGNKERWALYGAHSISNGKAESSQ